MFGFFYCVYNIIVMILLSFIILFIFEIKTVMKKLFLIIMIIPVLGTSYLNAQKLSKNSAFDILTKWEGKWKSNTVFEK